MLNLWSSPYVNPVRGPGSSSSSSSSSSLETPLSHYPPSGPLMVLASSAADAVASRCSGAGSLPSPVDVAVKEPPPPPGPPPPPHTPVGAAAAAAASTSPSARHAPFSSASYMAAFNPALYAAAAARVGADPAAVAAAAAPPFFSQASLFRISAANPFLRPGLGFLNLGAGGAFRPVSNPEAAAAAAAADAAYHSAFTPAKRGKLSPDAHSPGAGGCYGANGPASANHSPMSPHPLALVKDERPASRGSGREVGDGRGDGRGDSRCGSSEPDGIRPRRLSFQEGETTMCPVCEVALGKGEFKQHLQLEYERLIQLSRMPLDDNVRSPSPENKSQMDGGATNGSVGSEPGRQARQETFSRVRTNRQNRLCSRIRQRKRCFQEIPESTALSPVSPSSSEGPPPPQINFNPPGLSPDANHRSNAYHLPSHPPSQNLFPGLPPHSLAHLHPLHAHQPPPPPPRSLDTSSSSSSAPIAAASSDAGHHGNHHHNNNNNVVDDDEDDEMALDVDGDGDGAYGKAQFTEDDVARARDGRASSSSSSRGETSPAGDETRLMSEELQINIRKLLIEAIANNHKESLTSAGGATPPSSTTPPNDAPTDAESEKDAVVTSGSGVTSGDDSKVADAADRIIDCFMKNLKNKGASEENPQWPVEGINKRQRCHVCSLTYKSPLLSISCWHVHCQRCWLSSLGAKKLCPQCHTITSPSDLRRVFL